MGCCSSSEEDEDRRPVLRDASTPAQPTNQSGVPAEAVARLQKTFDEAEATETARKNSLLLKKEQQDRATRDALLAPSKKHKLSAAASGPAPVIATSAAPPTVRSPAPPLTVTASMPTSIHPSAAAFEIAKTPIASPPPIVSSVAVTPLVTPSAPPQNNAWIDDARLMEIARQQIAEEKKKEETVTDEKLVELARQQIIEEQKKIQTMKSAESILAQVETEAQFEFVRRSTAREQDHIHKAEEILAETEVQQHQYSLKAQQRRSVILMQRAEDILAETEKEAVSPLKSPSMRGLLGSAPASPSTTYTVVAASLSPSPVVAAASPASAADPFILPPPPALPTASSVQPVESPSFPSPSLPAAMLAAASQYVPTSTPDPSPRFDPIPTSPPPEQSANEHSATTSPALPVDYDAEKYPKGRVNFDYVARSENELPLKSGEIIRIWEDKGDDWSLGEANGRSGYFPGNYVQRIRITKRMALKKQPSNKILELQAKSGLLDSIPSVESGDA